MERDLRSQIDALESSYRANSPEKAELLDKAYQDIAACASTAGAPKAGAEAPDFTLPNAVGIPVRLSDALANGPVVLTFYRGIW